MIEKIKAVIFDIDGTLVNSMELWHQVDVEYFQKLNIPMPETIKEDVEGLSFTETAIYFKEHYVGEEKTVEEIKQDWITMAMEKYRWGIEAKAGAVEYVQFLKNHGIKIGVATSNDRSLAIASLEPHRIYEYVESLRTGCEFSQGKDSPEIYLKVAEDLGVDPEHCLVFEDIQKGIRTAKKAGMKAVAVWEEGNCLEADGTIKDFYDMLNGKVEVSYEFSAGK